jgi:bifunctional DNase/RNase
MSAVTQQEFIEMRVRDVRKAPNTPPDCHVVLLQEPEGGRRLVIWIGREQAFWLAWRMQGAEGFRPGTYDMTASAIQALGGQVREVRIDRLAETTFYATVVLDGPRGAAEVDARPSDALCLALTMGRRSGPIGPWWRRSRPPSRAPATRERYGRARTSPGGERSLMR